MAELDYARKTCVHRSLYLDRPGVSPITIGGNHLSARLIRRTYQLNQQSICVSTWHRMAIFQSMTISQFICKFAHSIEKFCRSSS